MASNLRSSFNSARLLLHFFLVTVVLSFLPTVSSGATQVTLAWDANSEPDLEGYRLYSRQVNQVYNYASPACDSFDTSCTVYDLEDSVEYCFIVRAYDIDGNESSDSNEVCQTSIYDIDNDGDGVTENQGDCDDGDPSIKPGAAEVCGDGVDQNCDGVDLTCPPEDVDDDQDGYTENQGDCNDGDPSIKPGAAEVCGDGVDQNCDGVDPTCANVAADAGPDQTVTEGDTVTLDGSNSQDPNGSIASYSWVQTSGPGVNLSGAGTATPNFIAPEVIADITILGFSLTVENSEGLTNTDTCVVAVKQQNQPPVADAGPDQKAVMSTDITLNGSNSTSSDDSALSYSWTQTSGQQVQLSDPSACSPTFQAPVIEQALVFDLTVTDAKGVTSSDSCIVNVSDQNEPPISFAGSDLEVVGNQTVLLDGSASLDDGGSVTYNWSQTEGPTVALSDPTLPTPEFTSPTVGPEGASLTFELTVTDEDGLKDTDSCIVNVTSENRPPEAVTDEYVEAVPETVITLDGTLSSDLDDGIDSYRWYQLEGLPVTFDNPKAALVKFTAPATGPYGSNMLFALKVKDKGGLKKSTKCSVFVKPTNSHVSPFTITSVLNLFQKGPYYQSKASVYVLDKATGAVVKDVEVKGHWSLPGVFSESDDTVIGYTSGAGEAKLDSERFTEKGTIKFTVTHVSKDGQQYEVDTESTLTTQ